ncbi:MAG: radical SAM family heme chaperone HemW [Spirochaetales bacterium]|nr:radical SAM family heme chaperone HemW [Spirochaetales bacterium]
MPSLYIHFPFCKSRCAYCDFYSCSLAQLKADRDKIFRDYGDKIIQQNSLLSHEFGIKDYSTVYLGGGTPSLYSLKELERIFAALKLLPEEREITIEVNPESLDSARLREYGRLGINRISMGVQSLDEKVLKAMGRISGREQALQSVQLLKGWKEGTWSADFIFAYPGQDKKSQLEDLRQFLALEPPHFSFYSLTVEEGTALHRRLEGGQLTLPDDEEMEQAWEEALIMIKQAGYERYEISSFCREEKYSQHNLAYWNSHDWIGLGPAAASKMGGRRFTGKDLDSFLASEEQNLLSRGDFYQEEILSREDILAEEIMMGLRTKWGIGKERLESYLSFDDFSLLLASTLKKWQRRLVLDRSGLRLTSSGLDWHSAVMVDLLLDLDKFFDYNTSL